MDTFKIGMDLHHIAMSVPDHVLTKIKPYLDDIEQQVLEGMKKSEESAQNKIPFIDNCSGPTYPAISSEERKVLEEISGEQKTLLDSVKDWDKEIKKRGYVN